MSDKNSSKQTETLALSTLFNKVGEKACSVAPSIQEAAIMGVYHYGRLALQLFS